MPAYATQLPPDSMPVIDGGWLLHFIRWKKNASYADVLGQCSSFLRTKYGMCCVLFDGYEYDSTKDHEHKCRQTGKLSESIVIAENAQVHRDQQALFSNEKNKTTFISLLTTHLRGVGHPVEVSCGDADSLRLLNLINDFVLLRFRARAPEDLSAIEVILLLLFVLLLLLLLYPVRLNSLGMVRPSQLWQKTRTC